MVLKTFNVREGVYKKFSKLCKSRGISMSKQIDLFMYSIVSKKSSRKRKSPYAMLMSQQSLSREWLSAEEDEAWKEL